MRRLLDLVGMTAGGWLGWMVGAWISLFTAFVVSVVGTGVGFYLARRVTKHLLP
jgi:positive regulator of sigma E activity